MTLENKPVTDQEGCFVLIPAFKPGECLIEIVENLCRTRSFHGILVVDDGSGEDYQPIFAQLSKMPGVKLLRHALNMGKGAALKTGFNHILCRYPQAIGIVTADADGQHKVEDIVTVACALQSNPRKLILGSRDFSGDIPFRSRFGNTLTRWVFGAFVGQRINDTQSGLRGIPLSFSSKLLYLKTSGYDFELDMLIMAKKQGVELHELAISTIYEEGNASSHFNPVMDSMRIYFVFLRFILSSLLVSVSSLLSFAVSLHYSESRIFSEFVFWTVGVIVQFSLNRQLVFHSGGNIFTTLAKFLSLVLLMAVTSYFITNQLVEWLGTGVIVSRIFAALLLYVPGFVIQRDLVFQSQDYKHNKANL